MKPQNKNIQQAQSRFALSRSLSLSLSLACLQSLISCAVLLVGSDRVDECLVLTAAEF